MIHATAIISPDAVLADDVEVGAFTVIESGVKISSGVKIDGHCLIRGHVEIGEGTSIGWGSVIGADPQDLSFQATTKSGVLIGKNNKLREYVTVHRSNHEGGYTMIGDNNFLMTGVHLAHDVVIGNENVLANNVLLAGHIHLGNKTFLGGGSCFHQFIHIGDYSIVQGNSAISQDVPPYCLAHGYNQLAGLNVVGLRRADFTPEQRNEIKHAYKMILCSGNLTHALKEHGKIAWSPAAMLLVNAAQNASRKGILSNNS